MHRPLDPLPDAAPTPPPAARDDAPSQDGLSNDYLNLYSEVLMLIELAPLDPEVVEDLGAWRAIPYPDYFDASHLRRAPQARAAWDALDPERRAAFEVLTRAMDRLATTAIRALRPPCAADDAALVAEVTAPALRRLIERAGAFLNSNGRVLPDDSHVEEAQGVIDRLIARGVVEHSAA